MSWKMRTFKFVNEEMAGCKFFYDRISQKTIYHSPEYIKVCETHFQGQARLCVFGTDDEFIYYPYFIRPLSDLPYAEFLDFDISGYWDIAATWYYGGPVLSSPSVPQELTVTFVNVFREYCLEERVVSEFVRYDPNINNADNFSDILPVKQNRDTIYVDLGLSKQEIWKTYLGRCRRAVRKALKYPVKIERMTSAEFLDQFCIIYEKEMIRKNAPQHYRFSRQFFDGLAELHNNIAFFAVMYEDKFVGGTVCLLDDSGTGYDFLTATDPDYWEFRINNLLFHEVILWCKENGLKRYDFHGGRTAVEFFKAAFSQLRGTFKTSNIIHDIETYNLLVQAKAVAFPDNTDEFFPQYRLKESN